MKSSEFITEAEVKPYEYKNLEVKKAVKLLNQYCTESLALIHNPIWRGMRNHDKSIVFIDTPTGSRESQNTSNYYTVLIDNSPYFKGWPKRSKSLICSSGSSYASGYSWGSGLYAIFPFDGAKIAVCPKRDMWETNLKIPELKKNFTGTVANMDQFNRWLEDIGFGESYQNMVKFTQTPRFANFMKRHYPKIPPQNFLPILQKALSPQMAGFKLYSIQEYAAAAPKNQELWIGDKVIALRRDMYNAFLDAYEKINK
ncbi:MAG TPA: hypothetical protein VFM18_16755 [Methanosarcina sp.]|nr:hypothetical protein [Methanosarcina sp.]